MTPEAEPHVDSPRGFARLDAVLTGQGMTRREDREAIRPHCMARAFARDQMLHRAGDVPTHIFFIRSGLVRFHYISADGREHNKSFAWEDQFAGAAHSAQNPEPARFFIQALEPVEAIAVDLAALTRLYESTPAWSELGRRHLESLAARKTRREAAFLLDSAEQRYRDFLRETPSLAERLPLYHVASYLGITDVALSRIRRRMRLNPG
ncbi:MAG: Crp/Fnr family transcriptional regulator [Gammaproteobacteria bacterium]